MKRQLTIFIVDDDKLFALALKSDIENGFGEIPLQIQSFETGEKCIEMFKEQKPEVVILDYHLNNKYPNAANGIEVLKCIKKENPETKVIIMTSDDNIDIALKSFHHGAFDYVVKTETQFRKINYSLLNLFKILESENYSRKYKRLLIVISLWIALLAGAVISIQLFNHSS